MEKAHNALVADDELLRAPRADNAPRDESHYFDALSRLAAAKKKAGESLWLGLPAPRYTSYPPATAFHAGVGADAYTDALIALNAEAPVSVYMHIPFCSALCLYCGCNTTLGATDDRVNQYLDTLRYELAMTHMLAGAPRRLSRLHFGGGSPNIMTPAAVDTLFDAMRRTFSFAQTDEIAMEIDPRRASADFIKTIAANGVNRVSLGVQDLNPEVQRAIRRVQDESLIAGVMGQLRENGIQQINFDLIYGLPLQTPETIRETAQKVVALGPDRIALYSYAHVPQIKKQQRALESYGLPGKYTLLAMERAARAVFLENGYVAIGMDHFARPRDPLARAADAHKLRRSFQGYTNDAADTLLAFGASSISRTPAGYFQSERDPRHYEKIIREDKKLPIVRGLLLTGQDRMRGAIIEQLMCHFEVDLHQVCTDHGYALASLAEEIEALKPFEEAGVIERQGHRYKLAIDERMAIRVVARVFDKSPAPPIASRTV